MRYWARTPKVLSPQEIIEAKRLRKQGYSRKQLADMFNVGQTTIWDNIYRINRFPKKPRQKRESVITYRKVQIVIEAVTLMRNRGLNSLETSTNLEIPLKEVNFIYSHIK